MSKLKDILIQYEDDGITPEQAEKKLIFDAINSMAQNIKYVDPEFSKFIKDIFPEKPNIRYWLFSDYMGNKLNYYYTDLDSYTKALTALSTQYANLYIVPVAFDNKYLDMDTWRLDCYAHYTNVIFVDIDEVDFDTNQLPKDLTKELFNRYPLLNKCPPNYIIKSGHGFHLYFLIDTLDIYHDRHKRQDITEHLITYFKADFACKNASRIMRCPFSYNCKGTPIKTDIIYHKNTSHNIDRLNIFMVSPEEVEIYRKECNKKVADKRKATMLKNGTTTGRKEKSQKKEQQHVIKGQDFQRLQSDRIDLPNQMINSYSPRARYRNILKDVHNYFVRHAGNIKGHRHNFVVINSWLLYKLNVPENEAIEYNVKYFTDDFIKEAIITTQNVYKHASDYHYANSTIATLLNFDDTDFNRSYCCYDDDSVKQRRIENNKRHAAMQKQKRGKAERTALIKERIKEYIKSGWKRGSIEAVAIEFEISKRTVNRLYKEIKEAGE